MCDGFRRLQWQSSYFIQRVNSVQRLEVLAKYTRIALLTIIRTRDGDFDTENIESLSSVINDMFDIRFYTKTIDTAVLKVKQQHVFITHLYT